MPAVRVASRLHDQHRRDRARRPAEVGQGGELIAERGALEVEGLVVDDVAAKPRTGIAHRRPQMPGSREAECAEPARIDPESLRVRADVCDRGLDVQRPGCAATGAGRRSGCRTRPRSAPMRRSAAPSRPSGRWSARSPVARRAGPPAGGRERSAGGRRPSAAAASAGRRRSVRTLARCMPGFCRTTALPASGSGSRPRPARRRARRPGSRARLSRPLLARGSRPPSSIHASAWAIPQRRVTYPK